MSRFQLLIREPGKDPSHVPITGSLVVGRSRRADVQVGDLEVGREQFRIGVDGQLVYVEGIGTTNRTTVDGADLPAGQRRLLAPGGSVRVGKTIFELLIAPDSGMFAADEMPGMTIQVGRPGAGPLPTSKPTTPPSAQPTGAPPLATPPKPEDQTGHAAGPMQTMGYAGPGGLRQPSAPPPAVPPPAVPPPAVPTTTQFQPSPAAGGDVPENTILNYRPGGASPQPRPGPPPPAAAPKPVPPTPAAAQPAAPPPAAAPAPAPAPTKPPPPAPAGPSPAEGRKPGTVALSPEAFAAAVAAGAAPGIDVEARLHEELPRLFVKCEGIKRRVRLLKPLTTIGRADTADVLLPIESVSERHAELLFDGNTWLLRDLGSTNGCLVDGTLLRSDTAPLRRHTLLGFGGARAIFLHNDKRRGPADQREEERAVRLLVQMGRLGKEEANEAVRIVRGDPTQSLAELLLMDTPLQPSEWSTAIATARSRSGPLAGLQRFFVGLLKRRSKPKP